MSVMCDMHKKKAETERLYSDAELHLWVSHQPLDAFTGISPAAQP